MIHYEQNNEYNYNTGKNTETMIFVYSHHDRYMMRKIRKLIEVLVDKRNSEVELKKQFDDILDECMRDYYGELKDD